MKNVMSVVGLAALAYLASAVPARAAEPDYNDVKLWLGQMQADIKALKTPHDLAIGRALYSETVERTGDAASANAALKTAAEEAAKTTDPLQRMQANLAIMHAAARNVNADPSDGANEAIKAYDAITDKATRSAWTNELVYRLAAASSFSDAVTVLKKVEGNGASVVGLAHAAAGAAAGSDAETADTAIKVTHANLLKMKDLDTATKGQVGLWLTKALIYEGDFKVAENEANTIESPDYHVAAICCTAEAWKIGMDDKRAVAILKAAIPVAEKGTAPAFLKLKIATALAFAGETDLARKMATELAPAENKDATLQIAAAQVYTRLGDATAAAAAQKAALDAAKAGKIDLSEELAALVPLQLDHQDFIPALVTASDIHGLARADMFYSIGQRLGYHGVEKVHGLWVLSMLEPADRLPVAAGICQAVLAKKN